MILAFLAREGLVDRGDVLAPRIASLQDIRRVHSDVYLESLHDLPVLESILGTQIAESQLDEVLDLHRLMVGGTIAAAKIALAAGCRMAITFGKRMRPLQALDDGAPATWFVPSATPLSARKRWIAGHVAPAGAVMIDAGAVAALGRGKSLLPAGVTRVEGSFERGDLIRVLGPEGREIARGLSAYGSADAGRLIGRRSAEIAAVLGYRGRDEVIHRDDLVMSP